MEAVADTSEKSQDPYIKKLVAAIGADNIKTSKMERLLYSHDLAPLPKEAQLAFNVIPDVVVRPRSAKDVSEIVKIANAEGVPITPRGASTWGLAGATPYKGGILIDMMGGMSKILNIDEDNMTITCEAGASWKQVYDAAWEKGFILGSYPSSFPSATVAGWISTAGIGVGNYKYGSAGDNIRNMKVVTPDGTIIETGFPTLSDNMSGYNLNRLYVGAEGTLGVICEVTFKLTPRPEVLKALAYAYPSLDKLGEPIKDITRSRVQPLHIAWSDGNHFKFLRKVHPNAPDVGSLLLVTLEGDKAVVEHEEKVIDEIAAKYGGVKQSEALATHEWDERSYEFRSREVGLGSVPMEVLVPTSAYSAMVNDLYGLLDSMKMEGAIIGIMADRNTVMFMPYYMYDAESLPKSMTSLSFNYKCGELAYKNNGRMLGGFGLFFASLLKNVRGEGYAVEVAIKKALDPKEIMNPGKLLGMKTRFGMPIGPGLLGFGMGAMAAVKKIMPGDKNVDDKAKDFEIEELQRERFEQHKNDPLKK
jgi:glycolate oxidase